MLNCQQAGILGAVAGTLGTIQATEAVKYLAGFEEGLLTDRLLTYDAKMMKFHSIEVDQKPAMRGVRRGPIGRRKFSGNRLIRRREKGSTMSFVLGLQCRECGQEYAKKPLHVCENCFGPLEIHYDYDGHQKSHQPRKDRCARAQPVALSRTFADRRRTARRSVFGLYAAGARPSSRRGARRQRTVRQGRLGQSSDLFLQGPRGFGRDFQSDRIRLRHRLLRVHRQPGQLGGRPRREGRSRLLRLHSRRPRAGKNHRLGDLRAQRPSPSKATTTTSIGFAPRSATSTAGLSSTSICVLTTPRAPRRTASKSPSNSAGSCRSISSSRPPAARFCRSWPKASKS